MLLSHIKELVKSRSEFEYSHSIYEELIKMWIEREAGKPKIREEFENIEIYQKMLYNFSVETSKDMYENRKERGGYFITKNDNFGENIGNQLLKTLDCDCSIIKYSEENRRTRSLLNRDAEGKYKFSHKSFLEYFLAKNIMENPEEFIAFNFSGMDVSLKFCIEMLYVQLKRLDLEYLIIGNATRYNNESLQLNNLNKIYCLKIKKMGKLNPVYLSLLQRVKEIEVSAFDDDSCEYEIKKMFEIFHKYKRIFNDKQFKTSYLVKSNDVMEKTDEIREKIIEILQNIKKYRYKMKKLLTVKKVTKNEIFFQKQFLLECQNMYEIFIKSKITVSQIFKERGLHYIEEYVNKKNNSIDLMANIHSEEIMVLELEYYFDISLKIINLNSKNILEEKVEKFTMFLKKYEAIEK